MIPNPTDIVAQPALFLLQLKHGEPSDGLSRFTGSALKGLKAVSAAKTGATVAASSTVANTLFAHTATGGILGALGLGAAAATPVGWIAASALVAGGGMLGANMLLGDKRPTATIVELETGLDVLAADLFNLVGTLAVRLAAIDGVVDLEERATIERQFVGLWGYAPGFVAAGLDRLAAASDATTVTAISRELAGFQAANPDCNADAMQAALVQFLRDLIAADGKLDERETLALDAIERTLAHERGLVRTAERRIEDWRGRAERTFADLRDRISGRAGPATSAAAR